MRPESPADHRAALPYSPRSARRRARRATRSEPDEEAYERSTNPEKFLIVGARARAWTSVLLDRGWARKASHVDWPLRPMEPGGTDTVFEPAADGAVH
ncbi:DUF6226 family protein [Rhodococcus sp. ZPP]|uniref:DUF6226 family protein n=1 Tax=Rhodococcus sp. ZPP TaxID=2749906 RepID=UPI0032995669